MKKLFISTILTLSAMSLFGQNDSFKLPGKWDKDFTITASHTGNMSGGSTIIKFTYESCTYKTTSPTGAPTEEKFELSETDCDAILKKLRDLKLESIPSGFRIPTQNDGWSHAICFGLHCLEAGSASHLSEEDMNRFQLAYGYLEDFARIGKTTPPKSFTLPKAWDKNFVISTHSSDNKRGGTVKVSFTFDSCTYASSTTRDPKLKNKRFALTQADRDAILAKLHELKIESVNAPTVAPQPVDWTMVVCLGTTCIDGGPVSGFTENDQAIFRATYRFLNDFAIKR